MENKEITMMELLQRLYNNAPKNIKYKGRKYKLNTQSNIYKANVYEEEKTGNLLGYNYKLELCLNDTVEILPEENEMKEMIYQKDRKVEILYSGTYKGYDFYIMNLGTHPTAYVNVVNNNLLNGKHYDDINVNVHGDLTYSENDLKLGERRTAKGWFIGWDYAHANDYHGYLNSTYPEFIENKSKKWTTEEIFEDVKDVIEQCINYEEDEEEQIDEWEDIKEIKELQFGGDCKYRFTSENRTEYEIPKEIVDTIQKLIKNQKYLKEKLENKDEK